VLIFVGTLVTLLSVFGGYAMEGGHLGALMQPVELLMIGGAGVGAFVLGNGMKTIKSTLGVLPTLFKGSKYNKDVYMELMALLYVLLAKARKEGTLTLEADIDDPSKSPIFTQYPKILADHHIIEFLTDYLRLMVGGNMNAFEIESLMDEEIETHHTEGEAPAHALAKVGDAMPAFGIVACGARRDDRPGAGRHLPRHSAFVWADRAALERRGTTRRRVDQDVPVHQGDDPREPEWLCAGDRRRIRPQGALLD
jgi:chemotaxis protein MotA